MVKDRFFLSDLLPPLTRRFIISLFLLGQILAGGGWLGPGQARAGFSPDHGPATGLFPGNGFQSKPWMGPANHWETGKRFRLGARFGGRIGLEGLPDQGAGPAPGTVLLRVSDESRATEEGEGREEAFFGAWSSILAGMGSDDRTDSGFGREEDLRSSLHRRLRLKYSPPERSGSRQAEEAPEIRSWLGDNSSGLSSGARSSSLWLGLWLGLENDPSGSRGLALTPDLGPGTLSLPTGWAFEPGIGLTGRAGGISFRTSLNLGLGSSGQAGQERASGIYPVRTGLGQGTASPTASQAGIGGLELAGLSTYGQVSWAGFSLGGGLRVSGWSKEAWSRDYDRLQAWSMLVFAAYEVILGKVVIRPEVVWQETALPGVGADPENSLGMGLFTRLEW